MKSKFFNTVPFNETFKSRVKKLAVADRQILESLKNWLSEINEPPKMDSQSTSWLAESGKITADESRNFLSFSWYLVHIFANYKDNPKDIENDLIASNILTNDEADTLSEFLEFTAGQAERLHVFQRIASCTNAAIPTLKSSSTAVSIRQITKQMFNYDDQSIMDYDPEIIDYVPLAEVSLIVEMPNGQENVVVWQTNADSLDRFISDFLALQKELECAKNTVQKYRG